MKVYRSEKSLVYIENEGYFTQSGLEFIADGDDNIRGVVEGGEILNEPYSAFQDESGGLVGIDQDTTLIYLNNQLVSIVVAAVWSNSDTTTNLNKSDNIEFIQQCIPVVSNPLHINNNNFFTRINDDVVQCDFKGEILITASIHYVNHDDDLKSEISFIRNPLSDNYIVEGPVDTANSGAGEESRLFISHVTNVDDGVQFAVGLRRLDNSNANCVLRSQDTSQLQLVRIG